MRDVRAFALFAPRISFKRTLLAGRAAHTSTRIAACAPKAVLPGDGALAVAGALDPAGAAPASAYVHLPFCVQKCGYCNFAVTVSTNPASHTAYVDVLIDEIRANFSAWGGRARALDTVYLGGGTPSVLSAFELGRVLDALAGTFGVARGAEVTAEMDPGTFDAAKARGFRAAGVNRASLGAQSTDDAILAACGRAHRAADVHAALHALREAGLRRVSVDVMAGLPGQSAAAYRAALHDVLAHDAVEHVAAYDLALEPGTPFARRYAPGAPPLPAEHAGAAMLADGERILRGAGFERYEISNYARGGDGAARSRHNMTYWTARPFLGFGLGATSLAHGVRFARPRVMAQYRAYVRSLRTGLAEAAGGADQLGVLYPGVPQSSRQDALDDFLINGFRLLVDGVNLARMRKRFADADVRALLRAVRSSGCVEQGLLEVVGAEGRPPECVRLTRTGAMLENSVLAAIMGEMWSRGEQ